VTAPRLFLALLIAALAAPVSAPAAAVAPGPAFATAPGRVVFAVDGGSVRRDVDAGGAAFAVALPDGGTLLLGSGSERGLLYAAKLTLSGALDPSFGAGGRMPLLTTEGTTVGLRQVLRQPDGKLLLIGATIPAATQVAPGRLRVTRLNADMTLDRSYGGDGTVTTALIEGCGACTTAALQPDGALLLSGATGTIAPPPSGPNLDWAIARLTPAGGADPSFGVGGIATIPAAGSTSGFNVALGPAGTIVADAQSAAGGGSTRLLLTRLTPGGAPDPAFAGGVPVVVPFSSGFLMLVQDDGGVVIAGQSESAPAPSPGRQLLARYTAAGAPDASFGGTGLRDLGTSISPTQLLPAAARAIVVVGTPGALLAPGSFPQPGRLELKFVSAGGAITASRTIQLAFGGGSSSFLVSVRPRPVADLAQNSFSGTQLVPRAGGSFLVPGAVSVTQPTGEGVGLSIGRFAAAALTPSLQLDPSFGGPASTPSVSVRLAVQRASTARSRHGIRISLKSSREGVARATISARGRVIARNLVPVFSTKRATLPVELTRFGNTYLRGRRNVRVQVSVTVRDLLANTRTARARGRLR
jgi:uncharacterized delta-60 repeat protein